MRRAGAGATPLLVIAVLAGLAVLAACSGSGSVSLPTRPPSVSLSSAVPPAVTAQSRTAPTIALPTVTGPTTATATATATAPTATATAAAPTATATAAAPTQTQTATRTETATVTQTETQTETRTATVTATPSSPETTAPTPEPVPTTPATAGTTWWPWVLLAVAVAVAALVWFLLRRRRAQAEVRAWDARLRAAEQEASWVEDSLTPQVLSRTSTAEAQTIWTAAQPRLLETDATFHALTTTAPDASRAGRATDIRGLLRGLVAAVGADLAGPAGGGPNQFRARRAVVDSARRELRSRLGPVDVSGGAERAEPR